MLNEWLELFKVAWISYPSPPLEYQDTKTVECMFGLTKRKTKTVASIMKITFDAAGQYHHLRGQV